MSDVERYGFVECEMWERPPPGSHWLMDCAQMVDQALPLDLVAAGREIAELQQENERLRSALKLVEYGSCDNCGNKYRCVECGADATWWGEDEELQDPIPQPHKPECPVGKALA